MVKNPSYRFFPEELSPQEGRLPERTTAGAFLIQEEQILLEKRPDDARVYPGRWDTPGGHVEKNETPEEALIREMMEELAILPKRFVLAAVQDDVDPGTRIFYRHYVYIVRTWDGKPRSKENRRIQWFDIPSALALPALNPLVGWALEDILTKGWLTEA
jgi:8-oxo-dGTP diphosphatase